MTQEVLTKFISEMCDLLKAAKDFTLEQAPKVAIEILHYRLAMAIVYMVIALIIGTLGFFLRKWAVKAYKENGERSNADMEFAWIFGWLAMLVACPVMFFINLIDLLKVTLAPRLYLIEYLSELLKQHK